MSRRNVLASGFIATGSALLLSDSDAFSQLAAIRSLDMSTSPDGDALLGLDVVPLISVGSNNEPLVTVTNNFNSQIDVSVELVDPFESESISPNEVISLLPDQSETFTVYVDSDREGGADSLAFNVNATDHERVSVDLTRRTSLPTLKRSIIDNTQNNGAEFTIQYQIRHVPAFTHMDLEVDNRGPKQDGYGESFENITDNEGVIQYPTNGSDGGAEGDTYAFTFKVYDENSGRVIDETVNRVANGQNNGDNDDLGSEDDPALESFILMDSTENNETNFFLEYEISNLDKFEEVVVTFDNPDKRGWNGAETVTETNESAPTGTVSYIQGGTEGDRHEVTVEVRNTSGLIVDSGTVCHVSGSANEVSYPDSAGKCSEQ